MTCQRYCIATISLMISPSLFKKMFSSNPHLTLSPKSNDFLVLSLLLLQTVLDSITKSISLEPYKLSSRMETKEFSDYFI